MLSEYDKIWCNRLLDELTRWLITSPFRKPVDPVRDNAPNYLNIVTNPMDFHTMKKKLTGGEYQGVAQFVDDIQLICDNAKKFNGASSMYGLICDDIMAEVRKQLSEKAGSIDEEWYKSLNKAIQALEQHVSEAPAEVSLVRSDLTAPKVAGLAEDVVAAIESELGGEKIDKMEAKWVFLSEETRTKILSLIEGQNKA